MGNVRLAIRLNFKIFSVRSLKDIRKLCRSKRDFFLASSYSFFSLLDVSNATQSVSQPFQSSFIIQGGERVGEKLNFSQSFDL